MQQQPHNDDKPKPYSAYARYTSMGLQMVVVIGLFTWLGTLADAALHNQVKWATAGLALFGVCAAMYLVFRSLKSS